MQHGLPCAHGGLNGFAVWAFERLGTHRELFGLALDALTPAAFKAARG
jgi:hypothetical protein